MKILNNYKMWKYYTLSSANILFSLSNVPTASRLIILTLLFSAIRFFSMSVMFFKYWVYCAVSCVILSIFFTALS